ncbi:hypothetical protein [Synechococcus sp. BIOS-U3-1]|nr:hypothetical protein [Synechococcus sp. BIOS-U3-1]
MTNVWHGSTPAAVPRILLGRSALAMIREVQILDAVCLNVVVLI